ncbi:MAG: glycosyltransferase [Cyanobacteria bacterium P01_C01_bin.72]
MSKITFLAIGSRGDVNPACILGQSLKDVGYQVCIATHDRFRDFVLGSGLEFAPIAGDYKQLLNSEAGLNTLEGKGSLRLISDELLYQQIEDSLSACRGSDLIIGFPLSLFGYHIAEFLNVRFLAMSYLPIVATKDFPFLQFGASKSGWLQQLNPLSYKLAELLLWNSDRQVINSFRQKFGLTKIPFLGVAYRRDKPANLAEIPIIHYFSSIVVPRPLDWSESAHITGYLQPKKTEYQPHAKLSDFLNQGDQPIYIGFGSMALRESVAVTKIIIEALKQINLRAILLSGWANLGQVDLPDNIYLLEEYVPFDWLFPRLKAVVHHGGSGTVALGLHAGIPQVVIPFFADQPGWGKRLEMLGVAPPPIAIKNLDTEKLLTSLTIATRDTELRQKAQAIASRLQQENGVAQAVAVIQNFLEPA